MANVLEHRVIGEYETIKQKKFWKLYIAEIEKYWQSTRNELETASDDRYRKLQGRVEAIKYILTRPDRIIETLSGRKE